MGQIMAKVCTAACMVAPCLTDHPQDKMPAAKVLFPTNNAVLTEGQDINFQVKVLNIQTGFFTNAQRTYYSAPQQLNDQGILIGHQHITVNAEPSADSTEPLDPQDFVFFKGLNDPAINDVLNATATGGLPAGFYRACTLGSSANHTPIVPPVANRASSEDCVRVRLRSLPTYPCRLDADAAHSSRSSPPVRAVLPLPLLPVPVPPPLVRPPLAPPPPLATLAPVRLARRARASAAAPAAATSRSRSPASENGMRRVGYCS